MTSNPMSSEFDVCFFDHACPPLHLRDHKGTELRRRVLTELDVELLEMRDDVGLAKHRVEPGIKLLDNLDRRPARNKHAVPFISFEAR